PSSLIGFRRAARRQPAARRAVVVGKVVVHTLGGVSSRREAGTGNSRPTRPFMAEVLPWQNSPDARATLARIVGVLDEGGLVAFPTETTYVLAASARVPAG